MFLSRTCAILVLAASTAWSGDLRVQVLITKRLTKKAFTAATYDLRGTVTPPAAIESSAWNPTQEMERIAVMLEGGAGPAKPPVTATMDQRGAHFEPDLLVVPTGSTVHFPNSDPIFHNVFSLSKAQSFDLGYYPKGQSRTVKITKPGVVQVYCHLHGNMYGAIVTTSSPWFGKPAADGSVVWRDIPPGRYTLTAWHKIAGFFRVTAEIPATGEAAVTIRIPIDVEARP